MQIADKYSVHIYDTIRINWYYIKQVIRCHKNIAAYSDATKIVAYFVGERVQSIGNIIAVMRNKHSDSNKKEEKMSHAIVNANIKL